MNEFPANEFLVRLRREECFFGVHFDFHATPDNAPIGGDVSLAWGRATSTRARLLCDIYWRNSPTSAATTS